MKSERLLKELGNVNEEYTDISKTESVPLKKNNRIKYITAGTAAALAVAVGGITLGTMLTGQNVPVADTSSNAIATADESTTEIAVEQRDVTIYYSEGGEMKSITKNMKCIPEIIFGEWKELNKSAGKAEFINCYIDNNGTEIVNESTVTYIVGDKYSMELTLSKDSAEIFEGEEGKALLSSLEKTFVEYFGDGRLDCEFSVKYE
ncbi:MAG: hypothetical protein ACI4JI_06560 [Ruminiclostridium sp.]